MTSAIQGYLKGIIDAKKPINGEITLIGETMKYKGIEVKKSTNQVSWFARFRKNGKQHYVSAKTQIECYNKLKELYNQNKKSNEINNNISLIDWYKQWLTLYKSHVRETTKDEYKNNLKHINNLLEKPINKITTIELLTTINKIPFERQKQKVYEFLNKQNKQPVNISTT